MYKVFPVEGGYQIFWCPHYLSGRTKAEKFSDARPYDKHVHHSGSAAYRRCKPLNDTLKCEAELERCKDEPLNTELKCWVQPHTMERLQECIKESKASVSAVVNQALKLMLYDQGY